MKSYLWLLILTVGLSSLAPIAHAGTIEGEVTYTGDHRRRKPVDMSVDANCKKVHGDAVVLDPRFVHAENGNLVNVFIYVDKNDLKGKQYDMPNGEVEIDQKGCVYIPHITALTTSQTLKIKNSDNTLHNVNCKAKKNQSFNEGMASGASLTKKFSKYERNINLKCDVHPWMGGKINVMDHPFFAVSDKDGKFKIEGLPAGEYKLRFAYESSSYQPVDKTMTVKVTADGTEKITVKYQRKPKKK